MQSLVEKYGSVETLRNSYFQLGRSFLNIEEYAKAEDAFLRAAKFIGENPLNWELNIFLGETAEKKQKLFEAVVYYLKAVAEDITDFTTLFDKIFKLIQNREAAQAVRKWVKETNFSYPLKPEDSEFEMEMQILFGLLELQANEWESSRSFFESIPDDAPKRYRIKSLVGLSEIDFHEGDYKECRQDIEAAAALIDHMENFPSLMLKYVRVFLALGQKENASIVFEQSKPLIENVELPSDLIINVADYFMEFAEWQQALYLVKRINSGNLDEHGFIVQLESLLALKRYEKAQILAENAFQLYPFHSRINMLRIQSLVESQKDIIEGVKLFNESFSVDLRRKELRKKVKKGYIEQPDLQTELKAFKALVDDSVGALNKYCQRRKDDNNAKFFLAFIYVLLKKDDDLVEDLLTSVRKDGLKDGLDSEIQSNYPFKAIKVLDGYRLEINKNPSGAASKYYQGAKEYYWDGKYQNAIGFFEKTRELEPNNFTVYWHLADSYKLLSRLKDPPYNDPYYLDLAYKLWYEQPEGIKIEDKEDYWGYLVGSRIHDLRFYFEEVEFLQEIWKSILYAERAILHKKDNAVAWTDLGKCYDNIGLYYTSCRALAKAKELNSDDVYTLEEYTKVLLNLYDFDEALECIAVLSQKGDYKYLSWQGFIEYIRGNYSKALEFIKDHEAQYPSDVWTLGIKMECYWLLKDFNEARDTAQKLLQYSTDENIKRQEDTYARAEFILGNTSAAINIAVKASTSSGDPYYEDSSLSMFYLYNNDLSKAEEQFNHYLRTELRKQALDLMVQKLKLIKQMAKSEDLPYIKELNAKIGNSKGGWIARLNSQMKFLTKKDLNSDYELKNTLEHNNYKTGTTPWLVIKAGMARISWENKEFIQAYKSYSELIKYPKDFPDVEVALKVIYYEIIEDYKHRLNRSEFSSIITELEGLDLKGLEVTALLILANLGKKNRSKAESFLIDYLRHSKNIKGQASSSELPKILLDTIPNDELYWGLINLIDDYKKSIGDSNLDILVENIRESLNDYWVHRLSRGHKTSKMMSAVTPIAIEISGDLIVEGPDTEWPVFKEYIPLLRDELKDQYHVTMPGVRIRGNEVDLPESTYILMIDEIPIASGTVRKNQLFVPDQLKELEQLNLSPGDMEQQLGGTWVDQNFKAELNEMNLEFWEDPFRHIIYHLKIQLIERLDFLYDLQMTFNYLNELDELPAHIKRIAEAIREDDNLLILFDKVLRGLLEERVAVKNKTAIINNFADLDPTTDHYLCIQQIRLILKSILPGNNPILEKINLPENIEQKIHDAMHNDGDKNFLAMEPVICQEVLTEIREMVSNYRLRDIVLEVNNTKLRPFVRNLIKIEFRDLLTIASEEVI